MRKTWVMVWLVAMLMAVGCQSQPFERETLTPLGEQSSMSVLFDVMYTTPAQLVTDDTVVIEIPFHDDLALISVARVDRSTQSLQLLGMNHLGVKLFHVAHDGRSPSVVFAAGPLEERKDILLSIAQDTWRIYFDVTPQFETSARRHDTTLVMKRKTDEGTLSFTIAGHPGRLIEKKLSTWWGDRWRISYFNYQPVKEAGQLAEGKVRMLHPAGIVLDNSKYHYRIIVHNRKWREVGS